MKSRKLYAFFRFTGILLVFILQAFNGFAQSVGIGTIQFVPTATLEVHGISTLGSDYALKILNTTPSTLLAVENNGNVGIGTLTPITNLDVHGNSGLNLWSLGISPEGGRITWGGDGTGWQLRFQSRNPFTGILVGTYPNLTLVDQGWVGVGTINPNAELHVNPTLTVGFDFTSFKSGIIYDGGSAMGNWYGSYISAPTGTGTITNKYAFVSEAGAGNVGIGNLIPVHPLDVAGSNSNNAWLDWFQPATSLAITNKDATNGNYSYLAFENAAQDQDAAVLGVHINATGTYAANNRDGELHFATSNPVYQGTLMTQMTITDIGNVGIGTFTPAAKLSVYDFESGNSANIDPVFIPGYAGMSLNGQANSAGVYNFLSSTTDQNLYVNRPAGKSINFRENNADQMIILSGGNVGIGTTNPLAQLQLGNAFAITGQGWPNLSYNDWYNNGTGFDEYMINGHAMRMLFQPNNGWIRFQVAPSGVANTDAGDSYAEGISIMNNGFVGIGGSFWSGAPAAVSLLSVNGGAAIGTGYYSTNSSPANGLIVQGNVGIGTATPAYILDVCGDIRATGSVYYGGTCGTANGTLYSKPDFVFKADYKVYSPFEVEKFISKKGHLPWVTSARNDEKENKGAVNMTRLSFETLEAVENMQLQIIEQQKAIEKLKADYNELLKKFVNCR